MNLEVFRHTERHWSVGGISALYVLSAWKPAVMSVVQRGRAKEKVPC